MTVQVIKTDIEPEGPNPCFIAVLSGQWWYREASLLLCPDVLYSLPSRLIEALVVACDKEDITRATLSPSADKSTSELRIYVRRKEERHPEVAPWYIDFYDFIETAKRASRYVEEDGGPISWVWGRLISYLVSD